MRLTLAMNLLGLKYDHPEFLWRLILTLETWLSFAAAGAGHGIFSVACASLLAPQLRRRVVTNDVINGNTSLILIIPTLITAVGTLNSLSCRVSRDYQLHYGKAPSFSQLLLLETLRLGSSFFSSVFLLKHPTIIFLPLHFLVPEPSALLFASYAGLLLFVLCRYPPELNVISSHSFTIPKYVARMAGRYFQLRMLLAKEMMAPAILKPLSLDDPNTPTTYKYAAILTQRTIRLLRLDSTQGTVSCTLETMKLDDAPPFWAVSYVWGSEENGQLLKIDGSSTSDAGYIQITSNCAEAIKSLIPMGVRYLWIDAVCINQRDTREKEVQIPLMRHIYPQASLVVGYLNTDSKLSVGLLIHRMIQSLTDGKKFSMDSGGSFLHYRALSEVFKHQYFQRAWIMPEMVLAKSLLLIHGMDCINLDHLIMISSEQYEDRFSPDGRGGELLLKSSLMLDDQDAWKIQEYHTFILGITEFRERSPAIEKLRLSIREKDPSQRLTIAQIVDHNLLLQAKYPRDRVYAILSLATDSTVPELQPNYSPTVSDKEIFTRISWHYLQDGNRLNLFLSSGLASEFGYKGGSRTPGLPSWVYDFAFGPARELRSNNWAANLERKRKVSLICRLSPEYLSIRGMILDRVAFATSPQVQTAEFVEQARGGTATTKQELLMKAAISLLDEVQGMVEKYVPDPYPGQVKREEAYWRAMVMDRFCDQTPAPPEAEAFFMWYQGVMRQMRTDPTAALSMYGPQGPLGIFKLNEKWPDGMKSIVETMIRIWMPYSFVILDSGYMGWSPCGVQARDVFCLFDGCIVPFILRPTAGADTFSLWGDGYIHGLMPGQQPGVESGVKQWLKLI
jgi:hypothetical protein